MYNKSRKEKKNFSKYYPKLEKGENDDFTWLHNNMSDGIVEFCEEFSICQSYKFLCLLLK